MKPKISRRLSKTACIQTTKTWIKTFVIGMNLCPFAKLPFQNNDIRYKVTKAAHPNELLEVLIRELENLADPPGEFVETVLIIHPNCLQEFDDYLDFLSVTTALLEEMELDGVFQIASFHPDYQFEGTKPEAVENYTNRSPYPMLHLLREESVSKAVEHYPGIDSIPDKNIANLRALGISAIKARWNELK